MRIKKKYILIGVGAASLLYLFPKIKAQFLKSSDKTEPNGQTAAPAPTPTPSAPKTANSQTVNEQKSKSINVLPARQHEITAIAIAIKNKFYFGSIMVPDRDYITRQINALKTVAEAQYLAVEFKRVSGRELGKEINRFFTPAMQQKINASYKNQF